MLGMKSFLVAVFFIIGILSCKTAPSFVKEKSKKVEKTTEEVVQDIISNIEEVTGKNREEVLSQAPLATIQKVAEALQAEIDPEAPAVQTASSFFDPATVKEIQDLRNREKILEDAISRNIKMKEKDTRSSALKGKINNTIHTARSSYHMVEGLVITIAGMESKNNSENNEKIAQAKIKQNQALQLVGSIFNLAQGATNYTNGSYADTTLKNVSKRKAEISEKVKEAMNILYLSV